MGLLFCFIVLLFVSMHRIFLKREILLFQIKEMTSELDALLESIEKPGGFRDVCTVSKRSLIEALEEQMQTLSGRCQMWKVKLSNGSFLWPSIVRRSMIRFFQFLLYFLYY